MKRDDKYYTEMHSERFERGQVRLELDPVFRPRLEWKRTCPCGREFTTNRSNKVYCDYKCKSKYCAIRTGYNHSPVYKACRARATRRWQLKHPDKTRAAALKYYYSKRKENL